MSESAMDPTGKLTKSERIWVLLRQLYAITDALSEECGRPCSPSGFCVGTPGELLVAEAYGLQLLEANTKEFDARTPEGEFVQIRTTREGRIVPIYGGDGLLLVVRLDIPNQRLHLIYGGPAAGPWQQAVAKGPNHRGVHSLGEGALHQLHLDLPEALRMKPVSP